MDGHNIDQNRASPSPWQLDVGQLLEEHHLVAWSHTVSERERFRSLLLEHLTKMPETQVCELHGSEIGTLSAFCDQLGTALGDVRVRPSVDAKGGVVDTLRDAPEAETPMKRRFLVWHDADALLRSDAKLFGRLVDALVGVAAEAEYASEDRLLLQRTVFIGAPSLDIYGEDKAGQFRSWFAEGGEEPLWQCITGLKHPRVLRLRIDQAIEDVEVVTRARESARRR